MITNLQKSHQNLWNNRTNYIIKVNDKTFIFEIIGENLGKKLFIWLMFVQTSVRNIQTYFKAPQLYNKHKKKKILDIFNDSPKTRLFSFLNLSRIPLQVCFLYVKYSEASMK